MKKTIAVIAVLCFMMTMFAGTVYAQANSSTKTPPISLQVLGKKISSSTPPIVKNNRVYVPFRAVGEAMGYLVTWASKSQTMEFQGSRNIRVSIGYNKAYVDGKYVNLDAVPIMYNERAYVPLTFIQKHFDYSTTYDSKAGTVTIQKKTAASNSGSSSTESQTKGIYVLGKKMSDKDLPITRYERVYVPLRHIGEGLGYNVTWNASSKTMTLKLGSSTVSVVIDNEYATINGKKTKLDSVPVLYNGRAYVPMTFIQNNFDYDISYDKEKNTVQVEKKKVTEINEKKPIDYSKTAKIQDIQYDESGGYPQLNIIADNPIKYKSFSMINPDRLVIDIENALFDTEFESKGIGKGGIIRARIAQFNSTVVRVVVDLDDYKTCKLVQPNDKKSISLIYANIIYPVSFAKEGDRDILMVRGSQSMDTNIFKLDNPERLVLDINKSVLNEKEQKVETNTTYVKGIRTGQPDVGVTRVVLDLEPNTYYDVEQTGNLTKIYISNLPFEFMNYTKYYNSAYVDLTPGKEVEYQPIIDKENKILKIAISEGVDVKEKVYNINDNIMDSVTVSKESYGDKLITIAAFKMKDMVDYELLSPAVTDHVKVKFKHKNEKPEHILVVIDAGHGGKDPGAVAKDGTKEKDLNLDVAKRLNRILKELGFETIMTRTDDSNVDLPSRSSLANNSYADFFMSIHFNAYTNSAIGIETLYFPNEVTTENPIDNKIMANIFHNEIIGALKRPSRGITPRPGLHVLNKTKMPAILAELGFITNPEELAQIKKPEYREMAARALASAIVKYFKEVQNIELNIDTDSIYSAPTPKDPYSLNHIE